MGKLREELLQSKPFRNLPEEAILNVWRTGDFVAHQLHQLLKTHHLSQTQYNVLRILRGAGKEGLPCGEIGGRMLTRDPDVTRLMDRLVKQGTASRTRQRNDRRVIIARITPAGMSLLEEIDPLVGQLIDGMLGHMKTARLETLIQLLEEVRHGQ